MAGQRDDNVPRGVQTVRVARKVVDLDVAPLILKSASGTPRSPVNNSGEVQREPEPAMQLATPEYVTAVMHLIESEDVSWNAPDVAKVLGDAVRGQSQNASDQQRSKNRNKSRIDLPSARLTLA